MKGLWLKKLRMYCSQRVLAYMSLVGAFTVQLTLGSIYTYGNMSPYIFNYLNQSANTHEYVTIGNSMWIFGLAVFGIGASMSLGGFIENKLGPISTILIGGWIMSFGVLITSETIKVHLALISLSYGLLAGLGSGIAYGVSLAVPCEWFPHAKGFVSGIIVGGFGLGSMVFDFLQSSYINNNPRLVKLEDTSRVPSSFLIFGGTYAVMQLIGSIIITRPIEDNNKNGKGRESPSLETFFDDLVPCNDVNISPHKLIYELDFWILWLTFALNSVVAVLVLSLHKVFGTALEFKDDKLVIVTAIASFCNGIGRIIWGFLNDKIRYKVLMSILTVTMSLFFGTFWLNAMIENEDGKYAFYLIWVIVLHLLLSGNFALFPTICVKTFGSKSFAENYGMLFTAYSFSGILTSVLTTSLVERNSVNRYLTPFLIGSGVSLFSGLITVFYRGRSLLYRNMNI